MDYEETRRVYDKYAREYDKRTKDYLQYIMEDVELFIQNLPGNVILNLGSGPGRDSLFFKARGLLPMCVDYSRSMIEICKEKGLIGILMDIENLGFADNSFDGIWAYTSLLHMPKQNLSSVLIEISRVLRPNGIFYIGMKEGNFEGELVSEKYPGMKRYFSLYRDEELREKLSRNFLMLHTSRVNLGDATFLNYLCRKKLM